MLQQRIASRIRAHGPMPFDEYMATCLYDPEHGFFGAGPLRSSKSGDFLTSPEVSAWFGRILARAVDEAAARMRAPIVFVETGAGSGSLAHALRRHIAVELEEAVAVEVSPAARASLLPVFDRVVDDVTALPRQFSGVVIGNELLDNLPVAIAVRTGDTWEERYVGLVGDGLGFVAAPARPRVSDWADAHAGPVSEGGVVEVQLAAQDWLETILTRLVEGAVILIDYGGTKEELAPRRAHGTMRTYRAHHLGPDPLAEPGATDITVDVNFSPLLDLATRLGWTVALERQDDFLSARGLRDELKALRRRELELARSGDEMARLVVRSELRDAETLLHPRGLGDFRVLTAVKFREPDAA